MLKSTIHVELPNAFAERHKTAGEWLRSLFGAKLDLRDPDHHELTMSALSLVVGLVEGFSAAGVTDVISFIVDKKVVYMDTTDVPDDLSLLLEAAEVKGILTRHFSEMHLVLSHKEAGLHVILDVQILNRVVTGQEQMRVSLSARIEELRVTVGETAADYRARIAAFMTNRSRTDADRVALDALTRRVAEKLTSTLVGARATPEPATLQIIAPGSAQLSRFRRLQFGKRVEPPRYRMVPTYQRAGAYADPFYYYYYDPYYDFMNWAMLDTMMHRKCWRSPDVLVVDPVGDPLGTGDHLDLATSGWAGGNAISFDTHGDMKVAEHIPLFSEGPSLSVDPSSADRAYAGDSGGGGGSSDGGSSHGGWFEWGGSSDGGSSHGGSSDGGSSHGGSSDGGSSSSCGSSCSSGSSCGSSCGGGGCGS